MKSTVNGLDRDVQKAPVIYRAALCCIFLKILRW